MEIVQPETDQLTASFFTLVKSSKFDDNDRYHHGKNN